MRLVGKLIMTAVVMGSLAGCGDGGGASPSDGATGPPPPPADQEKLFKKPGAKGARKGAFLVVPEARPVVVG